MLRRFFLIVGLTLQILAFNAAEAERQFEAPTMAAPDFAAQSLTDDQQIRLSDFHGQVVVLNFWASWCFPCRYEMPIFQKMYDRYRHLGFAVVAVAVYDELVNAKTFQRRYKLSFPMLFDTDEQAKQAFDVQVVPQTFVIGRDGRLVPITDPTTRKTTLSVNDPTLWETAEMMTLIEQLIEESTPRTNTVIPTSDRRSTS
jgi:peroxiredoxin